MASSAALVLPGMAACTPGDRANDDTLRVVTWASAYELPLEERLLDEYRRRHPEVRVELESVPGSAYRETVLTSIAAGRPPSVFLVDNASNSFLRPGLLVDLGRYAGRVGMEPDAYYPNVLDVFRTAGGKLYAFPKDFTPMVIYYNRAQSRDAARAALPRGPRRRAPRGAHLRAEAPGSERAA